MHLCTFLAASANEWCGELHFGGKSADGKHDGRNLHRNVDEFNLARIGVARN